MVIGAGIAARRYTPFQILSHTRIHPHVWWVGGGLSNPMSLCMYVPRYYTPEAIQVIIKIAFANGVHRVWVGQHGETTLRCPALLARRCSPTCVLLSACMTVFLLQVCYLHPRCRQ